MKQRFIQITSWLTLEQKQESDKYAVALKTYRHLTNANLADATNALSGYDQERRPIVPVDRPWTVVDGEVQTLRDLGLDVLITEEPCNMQTLMTLQQNALNSGDLTLVRILARAVYDVTEHLEDLE